VSYEDLAATAASVPPGAEWLLFLPYLRGVRLPHRDAARGSFFGLTTGQTTAHMTCAVVEGGVFSMKGALELITSCGVAIQEVRATGGARSALWCQMQADIFELPVRRLVAAEGPANGVALLAGVASGIYRDIDEACRQVRLQDAVIEPDPQRVSVYRAYYDVYRSLYPATHSLMQRLAALAAG